MANALNEDYYEGGKLYSDIEKLKASTKGKKSKQAQKDNAKRKELEEKYYGQGAKEGRKGKSTRKALLNDVAESNSKTKAAVENASSYKEM
jgi:hypothetical protein